MRIRLRSTGLHLLPDSPETLSGLRRLPLPARWACTAAAAAIQKAGDGPPSDESGVLVATNAASADPIRTFLLDAQTNGARLVNPTLFPETVMNAVAGHIAIRHGLRGPTATFSGGRLAGMQAIQGAIDLLATGQLRRAILCAVEQQPWTQTLEGYRPLEGAICLVLEEGDRSAEGLLIEGLTWIHQAGALSSPGALQQALAALGHRPNDLVIARWPGQPSTRPRGLYDPWADRGDATGLSTFLAIQEAAELLVESGGRAWILDEADGHLAALLVSGEAER